MIVDICIVDKTLAVSHKDIYNASGGTGGLILTLYSFIGQENSCMANTIANS